MPSGVENSKACGVMVTGPRPGTVAIPCQCKQVMLITVFKEGHTAVVCMQWQRRVTVRRTDSGCRRHQGGVTGVVPTLCGKQRTSARTPGASPSGRAASAASDRKLGGQRWVLVSG